MALAAGSKRAGTAIPPSAVSHRRSSHKTHLSGPALPTAAPTPACSTHSGVSAETSGDTPPQVHGAGPPPCQHQVELGKEVADDPDGPAGPALPRLRLGSAVRAVSPGRSLLPGFPGRRVPRVVLHGVRRRAVH